MATVQPVKDNFIRVGDIVTLKFLKHASYLSAEGILVEDVFVSSALKCFEEHQFQIYVQRQYSATNELDEFLNKIPVDATEVSDPGLRNHMEALVKGKENETTLNKAVMKNKTGNILSFGDTIQLLHVKSNKFITVRPNDLARDERENMKVTLSSDGSVMSWLKIIPRFKINREGEQITNNVEIQLKVLERSNEFLHCADRPPPRGKRPEVNSSLESPTSWKISIFQRSDDMKERSLLLHGQMIYIRDPESQCALAPLARPLVINHQKLRNQSKVAVNPGTGNELPQFQSPWGSSRMRMVCNDSTRSFSNAADEAIGESQDPQDEDGHSDDGSVSSIDEFVQDHGEVIFKPFQEGIEDTDAIWVMESKSITKGGIMKFRTDKVHFRHLNTGKYLSLHQKDEAISDVFLLHLDEHPSEHNTLFQINQLHSNDENLINLRAVQLKHSYYGVYFERSDYYDNQKVFSCQTTRIKAKSVSIILSRYEQIERKIITNNMKNMNEEILDIHFGIAVMYHIQKFLRNVHIPQYALTDINTLWPKMDASDRNLFSIILARTTLFIKGYPISAFNAVGELTKLKPDKTSILQRQNMFRQQGLLQAMVNMLHLLNFVPEWISNEAKQSTNRVQKGVFLDVCKEILSECLNMVYDLIKGNLTNQLYIADYLLVILAHISTDKMAANVAKELLSSNRELQETKIGLKEITIFANEMKKVPMNSMYLQLLQTCCSCLGQGLPKNQDIVHSVVFAENGKDILIEVRITNDQPKVNCTADWGQGTTPYDLYIAPHLGKGYIKGERLCSEGPVQISLTWSGRHGRFSPGKLFSKEVIPLWDVYRTYIATSTSVKKEGTRRESNAALQTADGKRSVCDFFIAQLQVSAEMCLGRNYHVITQMEKIYSYEALVTIVKAQSGSLSNDVLKRSAAYLIQTLYVDRDPQSSIQLPRLTRTLTDITSTHGTDLVRVGGNQFYQFSLLQTIISRHLLDIRGKAFAGHTHNLMKILHKLVEFNFYGEVEKLKEIIEQLVSCLKRDDFDLDQSLEHTAMLNNMMKLTVHFGSSGKRMGNMSSGGGSSKRNILASQRSMLQSDANMNSNTSGKNDLSSKKSVKSPLNTELFPAEGVDNDHTYVDYQDNSNIYHTILNRIESKMMNVVMAVFVSLATAVSIYMEIVSFNSTIYMMYDYAVFIVIAVEVVVHTSLYIKINHTILPFCMNIFNTIDIVGVILYLILYIGMGLHLASFVKYVRLFKAIYLAKDYFLVYILQYELEGDLGNGVVDTYTWNEPERYSQTPDTTIGTLVKIVQVLCLVQGNIEDQKLSLLLKSYLSWAGDQKATTESAYDVLLSVLKNTTDLYVSNTNYDDLYIDLLMYSNPVLVQATLQLLMTHHSSYQILIDNSYKLQLISTETGEEQYTRMEKLVNILKRDADTHEIWGNLKTAEFRKINNDVHKYLLELTENCKKLREILKFDEKYEPIKSTQNILRNLSCFQLCMKLNSLITSIDNENQYLECHINTKNIALASNRLLYWFVLDNPANQSLAYTNLNYFIKTIDSKIESDKVISAIFRNNITLMESVPKKYISEFIDMICNVGRFPQYLSLMSSIICVGEKNVIENQYEVIKLMSSPDNMKKVVQYFVPVNHPAYQKKIQFMAPFLSVKDVTVDDLPSDLAYHLDLMGLLSSCTVGRSGMTTIEAKVQSMFNFVDIVEAMLDNNTILLAKIRLGQYLFNAMLDVETLLPAVKDAECIWKLLITTQDVFSFAKDDLRSIEKNGWEAPSSNRQKIEYMVVCLNLVNSYFSDYYDYTIFKPEVGQTAYGVERITIKEGPANDIIRSLYFKISMIYEMLSPLLSEDHHQLLFNTLISLNNAAKEKIVADVEDIHTAYMKTAEDYSNITMNNNNTTSLKSYEDFQRALLNNENVNNLAKEQIQDFIKKLEEMPWKNENVTANVRFEPLIEKLVTHIRGNIQLTVHGDEAVKYIDPSTTKTDIWILRIFRTMVENKWGMSIYERDDDGGEEQDDAVVELMKVYNEAGVTNMCLDLISKGIDIALQSEALKLLVAMLFKEGGAIDIQKTIHAHLSKAGSEMFFRNVRMIMQNLMSWHKWNGVIILEEDQEPELPDEIILIRCLQLMCEGHYQPNQNIFREQPNNVTSINLLDDFVLYLQALDNIKCRTSTSAELAVCATILEVIQGPCEGNQDYFALNTELIETLNRKLRQHPVNDCDETQEVELKKSAIDIFQALLEGQARKTAVYERMLSVIHIDVILVLCKGEEEKPDGEAEEESDESVELRTESLVLMQMLTDFRPSLKTELGIQNMSELIGGSVACIEVVWRGELQRRFFHVPDICMLLAKSTKDNFIANVCRDSPEDKLYGLLESTKEMYREILHQQLLTDYKIDKVFSRTNQDRATWLTFYIVLIINILFVLYYHATNVPCPDANDDAALVYTPNFFDDEPPDDFSLLDPPFCTEISLAHPEVIATIRVLNFVLIFLAMFVLLLYLVVRVPVNYQSYIEANKGVLNSALLTAMDPVTMYYFFYLALSILGIRYHIALTILLLDFVSKSPTSQSVLAAVYNPRKQIFMTLVLAFIVTYIFAMYMFFFFNTDENFADESMSTSLGNVFKFLISKGLPQGSATDYMVMSISYRRIAIDLGFFVSLMLILNILKGITIDTFVELRNDLEERMEDTTERCFICGIEKNTFNRTLDREAFTVHTQQDQNLWSYVYFIIYIWQQDKDDDDGLESFVRHCIESNDLFWFPMRKAIRLSEHQEKGDIHSMKYRFRKDLEGTENIINSKMATFKDQLSRTIGRVEKSLEYEADGDGGKKGRFSRTATGSTTRRSVASRQTSVSAPGGVSGSSGPSSPVNMNTAAGIGAASTPKGQSAGTSRLRPGVLNINAEMFSSMSSENTPTALKTAQAAAVSATNRLLAASSQRVESPKAPAMSTKQGSTLFTSALDADKLGQVHIKVISIIGLNIQQSQVEFISVRLISEMEQTLYTPEPQLERVKAFKTMLKNIATEKDRGKQHRDKFRTSFVSVKALFKEHENETGNLPEPTLLKFNVLDNPRHLVHQGRLPTVDLSKYNVKVQILYGGKGEATKLLAGVHIPFVELLNKAHTGEPLEVPLSQRQVDRIQHSSSSAERKTPSSGSTSGTGGEVSEFTEKERLQANNFCYITLSAIASNDLLQEWAMLMTSHH